MDDHDRTARLDDYERGFRRAGLPLLIEDFSAREDVFNRAFPLLALVLLAELIAALDVDWSWVANAAAVLGALAVTLAAVAAVNRARGRSTWRCAADDRPRRPSDRTARLRHPSSAATTTWEATDRPRLPRLQAG